MQNMREPSSSCPCFFRSKRVSLVWVGGLIRRRLGRTKLPTCSETACVWGCVNKWRTTTSWCTPWWLCHHPKRLFKEPEPPSCTEYYFKLDPCIMQGKAGILQPFVSKGNCAKGGRLAVKQEATTQPDNPGTR